ncbi:MULTISPECIES: hypothetical protein [unclassified Rhodococcus (in: high G+C Gram-positive bacteria)]|jgi:hypothetical protein|uniref:hypothetical protein n=1 Tax=unclassified Rhodococcus (in: high G+C Gram-positive bacteria) TaxID=192944 RepID=UPI000484A918|nr:MULTISPECIES: hypothetical protein [unclassified Rhodococcus (in: high G+C Gram-positive bacteria)]MBY6675467.1 hypothetical protein [Rhodococcus sp. BP-332]MBY6686966.1 hypothetical protein [Rhodococcus sp. BP-288]MBY6693981.1 hypothetical protein [Rhodococcus sp. BP-188]MBY6699078.1 hypothetical protein [Rhodococcus sp. BP-285]MBY6702686.1 hypothetical protein [Rhodococcus sp. BP-283]
MTGPSNAEFSVEDVSVGAHAHGFGSTPDGRSFAFRVRGKSLRVEVYRSDLAQAVPDDLDVDAVAERDVTDVDLSDERSIVAAVRDAVADVRPLDSPQPPDTTLLRSLLGRLGNAIDPK